MNYIFCFVLCFLRFVVDCVTTPPPPAIYTSCIYCSTSLTSCILHAGWLHSNITKAAGWILMKTKPIGRLCFASNDLGEMRKTKLPRTIFDLQHRVIQFRTHRCSHIQHHMQISKQLECHIRQFLPCL